MVTFPGADQQEVLRHILVGTDAKRSIRDGAAAEVEAVVELVLAHAQRRPDETLGVIALGIEHATRIEDALRARLEIVRGLDDFFDEGRDERFFVKNLERVQGDERDAIILSVGYGKAADGRVLYRFGPLNLDGGERRLNVAVTRARKRMTIVSSFSAAEMDPARTRSRGAALLREYLEYAERNGSPASTRAGTQESDPVEQMIGDRLRAAGVRFVPEVGASGQVVDIAVVHPVDERRYFLAVETDGPTYERAQTVRDRDRIREEQLGRLGWAYHRSWCFEWYREPQQALARLMHRYQAVGADEPGPEPDVRTEPHPTEPTPPRGGRGPRPNIPRYYSINDYWPSQLVELVNWVESDGRLRTEEEVIHELMRELGFARRGSRIVAALTNAIRSARRSRAAGRA